MATVVITTYDEDGNLIATRQETTTAEADNIRSLLDKTEQALDNNVTFLNNPTPTNAESVAQLKALTRQVDALIRFLRNDFTDISDT
jgi:hypothetical protein